MSQLAIVDDWRPIYEKEEGNSSSPNLNMLEIALVKSEFISTIFPAFFLPC